MYRRQPFPLPPLHYCPSSSLPFPSPFPFHPFLIELGPHPRLQLGGPRERLSCATPPSGSARSSAAKRICAFVLSKTRLVTTSLVLLCDRVTCRPSIAGHVTTRQLRACACVVALAGRSSTASRSSNVSSSGIDVDPPVCRRYYSIYILYNILVILHMLSVL